MADSVLEELRRRQQEEERKQRYFNEFNRQQVAAQSSGTGVRIDSGTSRVNPYVDANGNAARYPSMSMSDSYLSNAMAEKERMDSFQGSMDAAKKLRNAQQNGKDADYRAFFAQNPARGNIIDRADYEDFISPRMAAQIENTRQVKDQYGDAAPYILDYQKAVEAGTAQEQIDAASAQKTAINKQVDENSTLRDYLNAMEGPQLITRFTNPDLYKARQYADNMMSPEERNIYLYTVASKGLAEGNKYLDTLNLNERASQDAEQEMREAARRNPIAGTGMNVALKTAEGTLGLVNTARTGFRALTGQEKISADDPAFRATRMRNALLEGSSEGAQEMVGANPEGFSGSLVNGAVSIINSMADSQFGARVLAGPLVDLVNAGSAANSALLAHAEDDISALQLTLDAIANGAAEAAFEHISIENTRAMQHTPVRDIKDVLKNLGKSFVSEGSEELFTSIADTVADDIILNRNSDDVKEYQQRVADGEPAALALLGVIFNDMKDAALEGVAGGIAGFGSGAIGSIEGRAYAQRRGNELFGGNPDLKAIADNVDTNAEHYTSEVGAKAAEDLKALAERLDAKQKNGKQLTNKDRLDLYRYWSYAQEYENQAIDDNDVRAADGKDSKWVHNVVNEPTQDYYVQRAEQQYNTPTDMTAQDVTEQMAQASTAQELVQIRKQAETSQDEQVRQAAANAFDLNQGRILNTNTQTAEDFGRAEQIPTEHEAYLRGLNGEKLAEDPSFVTAETQLAYNEGQRTAAYNRSNESLGEDFRNVQIQGSQDSADVTQLTGKIESVGANAVAQTQDGTVAVSDISDPVVRHLYERASAQGTREAAQAMLDNYAAGMPIERYAQVFDKAYLAGATGTQSLDDLMQNDEGIKVAKQWMSADQIRSIYEFGQQETETVKQAEALRATMPIRQKGTGQLFDQRDVPQDDSLASFARVIASTTGYDVYLKPGIEDDINGMIDRGMQMISINADRPAHAFNALIHEGFGEVLTAHNFEGKARVQQAVMSYIAENPQIMNLSSMAKNYQHAYAEGAYEALGEATNDAIAGIFATEEGIKDFSRWAAKHGATEHRSIMQAVADFFQSMADAFHDLLSKAKLTAAARSTARMAEARAKELRKLILDEMDVAIANAQSVAVNEEAQSDVQYSLATNDEYEGGVRYSIDTFAESLNLSFEKDGNATVLRDQNGNRIRNMTADMVRRTPLGATIDSGIKNGFITAEDAKKEYQFVADLINQMLKTQDLDMVFAVNSVIGFQQLPPGERDASTKNPLKSKNAGYVSNSDPQYSSTVDFTTICVKTQAIIDVMSEVMKRRKAGLSPEQITEIVYKNTHKAGEPVPCPVCYVFSRWVGLGGLFDNMYKLQEQYADADTAKIRADLRSLDVEIAKTQEQLTGKKTKSKAKEKLYNELKEEMDRLEKLINAEKLGGKTILTEDQRKRYDLIKYQIGLLDNYTWLDKVRLAKGYKPVPAEVLFDINAGTRFANEYPESWRYRTTRGPAMGKAATPYADEHLGQIIRGISAKGAMKDLGDLRKNPFILTYDKNSKTASPVIGGKLSPTASGMITRAINKAKAQNLLNGQRMQSTSDFRFEYALDYLMALYELQSVGAKVQMYTKVPESVGFLASVGTEVNASLMPYGDGYEVNKDGTVKLLFSKITGMHPDDAFRLQEMYDNVQGITVGVNDTHIRALMADPRIFFIIPYHASGSNEKRYRAMMEAVGESVKSRDDYSNFQTDAERKDATPEQIAARDLRVQILTGKSSKLTEAQKEVLRNNEVLHQLYQRFYGKDMNGGASHIDNKYLDAADRGGKGWGTVDHNTLGVFMTADQTKTIMPYEYWDKSLTIDQADQNGRAFQEYCEMIGLRPRFSGYDNKGNYHEDKDFSNVPGYWKTLPDRRMYNRDGTYHEQKAINVSNMRMDYLDQAKTVEGIVQPSVENKRSKVAEIADKSIRDIEAAGEKRYSLDVVDPIEPTSGKWQYGTTFAEAKAMYPRLFDTSGDTETERNPTQIAGTVKTYRKVYDYLKNIGFDGSILDASSGLGEGTRVGRNEYGYDVDDIEPYPSDEYAKTLRYQDYSQLFNSYDFIINNAVMNVMCQDDRDALVKKIGEMLNPGGTAYINVRAISDVESANGKQPINAANHEWYMSNRSYQKGFSFPELIAYLQDGLGDEFTIEKAFYTDPATGKKKAFPGVSVFVHKSENAKMDSRYTARENINDVRMSRQVDSDGRNLTQEQAQYFADSKVRDDDGNLKVMYHGTKSGGFTVFDKKKLRSYDDGVKSGFFFTDSRRTASAYSLSNEDFLPDQEYSEEELGDIIFHATFGEWELSTDDGISLVNLDDEELRFDSLKEAQAYFIDNLLDPGPVNYKVYLDLKNPLIIDTNGAVWYAIEYKGKARTTDEIAIMARNEGYDGVIFKNVNDGPEMSTVAVTFESNQAKSVENRNPTTNPDIRYSRYIPDPATEELDIDTLDDFLDRATDGTYNVFKKDDGSYKVYGGRSLPSIQVSSLKEAQDWINQNVTPLDLLSLRDNWADKPVSKEALRGLVRLETSDLALNMLVGGRPILEGLNFEPVRFETIEDAKKYLIDHAEEIRSKYHRRTKLASRMRVLGEDDYTEEFKASRKYRDSEDELLSKGQQKYFADSKIRDDKGRLIVMYHGTQQTGFTVFDPQFSDDKISLFFTDNPGIAASYSGGSSHKTFTPETELEFKELQALAASSGMKLSSRDYEAFNYGLENVNAWLKTLGEYEIREEEPNVEEESEFEEDTFFYAYKDGKRMEDITAYQDIQDVVEQLEEKLGAQFRAMDYSMAGDDAPAYALAWNDGLLIGTYENLYDAQEEIFSHNPNNGRGLYKVYVKAVNPLIIDVKGRNWNNIEFEGKRWKTRELSRIAKARGYDGVFFQNIIDIGGFGVRGGKNESNIAIVFNGDQVKSVDNKVPTDNPDIRYSRRIAEEVSEDELLEAINRSGGRGDYFAYHSGYGKYLLEYYDEDGNQQSKWFTTRKEAYDFVGREITPFTFDQLDGFSGKVTADTLNEIMVSETYGHGWVEETFNNRIVVFMDDNRYEFRSAEDAAKYLADNKDAIRAAAIPTDANGVPIIDTEGQTLSPGQQKFFRDSKVRDAQGALITMYKGAGNAGYTVFSRDRSEYGVGWFFTSSKGVAYGYAPNSEEFIPEEMDEELRGIDVSEWELSEPGDYDDYDPESGYSQSQNYVVRTPSRDYEFKTHQAAVNFIRDAAAGYRPGIYKVYLNLKNPLVVDAEFNDWRYIPFEGNRMSTDQIAEVAKERGYDGMIIKNVEDTTAAAYERYSTVAQAFEQNQIKSVANLNPTDDPDIRKSLNMPDDEWDLWMDIVEQEYQKNLKDAASILEEGSKALKGQQVDEKLMRQIAVEMRKRYGSTYDLDTFADNLQKVFAYAQENDGIDYNDLMKLVSEVAQPVIDEATKKIGEEEYKAFVNAMRGYRIALTDRQMQEVKSVFGSYQAFQRAMRGIHFVKNGTPLDSLWSEIVDASAGVLDIDTTEGDMPIKMFDALTALTPTVDNIFGYDGIEAAQDLAVDIVARYFEEAGRAAGNAKAQAAAEKMKARNQAYRAKVKAEYAERLKEERKKLKEQYKDKKAKFEEDFAAKAKARNKKAAERKQERAAARHERERIRTIAGDLYQMIVNPTEKRHIMNNMIQPITDFLSALDFVTPQIKRTYGEFKQNGKYYANLYDPETRKYRKIFGETPEEVQRQLDEAIAAGNGSNDQRKWSERMQAILDIYDKVVKGEQFEHHDMDDLAHTLSKDLYDQLQDVIKRNGDKLKVSEMNSADLKVIKNVLKNIKHAALSANRAFVSQERVSDIAEQTMNAVNEKTTRKERGKLGNKIFDFAVLNEATPDTYFDMIGSTGVYGTLRTALNKKILNVKAASEAMEKIMDGVDADTVKSWDEVHEYKVYDNKTVRMTDKQVMSLYELNKRQQARFHQPGGVTVSTVEMKGEGWRGKLGIKVQHEQHLPVHLTDGDIIEITSHLTPQQIRIADAMQQYMAVDCSTLGNEASRLMYGFDKFTDPNYFPIRVDRNAIGMKSGDVSKLYNGIAEMGFTKQVVPHARNAIVIDDIFDVFTNHVSDMASYNAYAPAIADALRWYNYRTTDKDPANNMDYTETVQGAIQTMMGASGKRYFEKLIRDLNEQEQSAYISGPWDGFLSNYKTAAIGANIRVVIQQPTAIVRARKVIGDKYLLAGLRAVGDLKKASEHVKESSPIGWWKSQGYYESNIGRSMKQMLTGQSTKWEELREKSLALAGLADDVTWAVIYTGTELEQADEFRKAGKATDGQEYRDAVNKRFDEIIDQTQVVDSTLHRSGFMRSTDQLNKLQASFMAEPTKSYNMLLKSYMRMQRGGGKKELVDAIAAFIATAIVNAAAQSLIDALRSARKKDDEDYWQRWGDSFVENAVDNINPANLMPWVKDVSDMLGTFIAQINGENTYGSSDSSNMATEGISTFLSAAAEAIKYARGDSKKTPYGVSYGLLRAFSQLSGMPVYNLVRDVTATYDSLRHKLDELPDLFETSTTNAKTSAKNKVFKVIEEGGDYKKALQQAAEKGTNLETFASTLTSHYKPIYLELLQTNKNEAVILENRLEAVYKYLQELNGKAYKPRVRDWAK